MKTNIDCDDRAMNRELAKDSFIREYVKDLEMAHVLLEAGMWHTSVDKITHIAEYYPQIIKLRHWKIAKLTGLERETVSRAINDIRETKGNRQWGI